MFQRIIFENWVCVFPLVAFITAASVYATILDRTLRMKNGQIDHFSQLPFAAEASVPSNESK